MKGAKKNEDGIGILQLPPRVKREVTKGAERSWHLSEISSKKTGAWPES